MHWTLALTPIFCKIDCEHKKVEIYEQIQSCHFGDFCGNSPKERLLNCVRQKSKSLLYNLYQRRHNFQNHLYKENR